MNIVVLTATYNRINNLAELRNSLNKQENNDFIWTIVDDGSTDNTEEVVMSWKNSESPYEIRYLRKENGGKSRAINYGIEYLHDSDFVIIIDDDEILYPNAIDSVKKYVEKYKDTNCGGMEFLRNDMEGRPISNYQIKEDLIMSVQERKSKNLNIDGYAGYYIEKIGSTRFPEYEGEKYVGPGVLQMLMCRNYDLVWPACALGKTEYLQGGITKSGRPLRLKNPKGMICYCSLLQEGKSSLFVKLKYSIMGYAYKFYANLDDDKQLEDCISKPFLKLGSIPGRILCMIWRKKYK